MNHAFNWERSIELPIDVFEENENRQIVEAMITIVSILHNQKNMERLIYHFEDQFSKTFLQFSAHVFDGTCIPLK